MATFQNTGRKRGLTALLCAVSLSACSGDGGADGPGRERAYAPPPPQSAPELAAQSWSQPGALAPGDVAAIAPAAGIPEALEPLPAPIVEPVASAPSAAAMEARLQRLEAAVEGLRSDYDRMMPAFDQLLTTNERIKSLLGEIEAVQPQAAPPPPASAAPQALSPAQEPETAEEVQAALEPQEAASIAPAAAPAPAPSSIVQEVRIGEHTGKTRLVLDVSAPAEFAYEIDNAEKLLRIRLPDTGWKGNEQAALPASPLVAGWSRQQSPDGGSSLTVQLRQEARVLSAESLSAVDDGPARIVIDIAPSSS